MTATDYDIINKCLAGQQDVFAVIVTRYKRLISNVVYNYIGSGTEVNDLSQEVFLKIYRSLHQYNPDYKFATWAQKIAVNVCIDWLRRKKNEPQSEALSEEIPDLSPSRSLNPEGRHIEEEELSRIRRAVNGLPEKYRIPVALFHHQGLSYKEMEEVLNLPVSIIKNRLYRGRLMLKDKLCSEEGEF